MLPILQEGKYYFRALCFRAKLFHSTTHWHHWRNRLPRNLKRLKPCLRLISQRRNAPQKQHEFTSLQAMSIPGNFTSHKQTVEMLAEVQVRNSSFNSSFNSSKSKTPRNSKLFSLFIFFFFFFSSYNLFSVLHFLFSFFSILFYFLFFCSILVGPQRVLFWGLPFMRHGCFSGCKARLLTLSKEHNSESADNRFMIVFMFRLSLDAVCMLLVLFFLYLLSQENYVSSLALLCGKVPSRQT